jgi:hypothetical protein
MTASTTRPRVVEADDDRLLGAGGPAERTRVPGVAYDRRRRTQIAAM